MATVLRSFSYDDSAPWPTPSDGEGFSLVLTRPWNNPDHSDPFSWRPSSEVNGLPTHSDSSTFAGNPDEDDNQDGVPNLLHYAAVGTGDYVTPFVERISLDDGAGLQDFPVFAFRRNLSADDLEFTVETSVDLSGWSSSDAVLVYLSMEHNNDGTATYRYRSLIPLGSEPDQFFRLKVVELP